MSYPKKLLRLKPRRGVSSDLPSWAIGNDFYTQADNVLFRLGVAERVPSKVAVYDPPSVAPYGLLNVQIDGVNFWIYQGATASFAVQSSVHTDITHAGGLNSVADASKLSLSTLNGVPFLNNSLDEPMFWDGNVSNNFVTLPDWTATETCLFMVAHRFHLFAFGIDGPSGNFNNQVKWSDAAAPGNVPSSWSATAANEAGDNVLADTPGALVSAANLRDTLMIYKGSSAHAADYIGGQEIYAFRTVFTQLGALARNSVADVGGQHFIVTDGDIVLTDGTNVKSLAQNRRKRFLFNQLDQDNFQKHFVSYHREKGEVWLCFPEAGESLCTRAMIYDVANDAWGDRELPAVSIARSGIISDTAVDETWDADSEVWDDDLTAWNQQNFSAASEALVLAQPGGPKLFEVGRGTETLTSVLGKHSMDFGEPERFKFVKRMHIRVEGDTGINFLVRVGTQQTAEDSIAWSSPVTINSNTGFANVLAMGRFISLEVKAITEKPFKVTGIDLEAELRGYH